jgi:CheY-like chemotaxis protein
MNSSSTPNRRVLVIDDNLAIHKDLAKVLAGDDGKPSQLLASRAALFQDAPAPAGLGRFEVEFADQGQAGFAKVQHAVAQGTPYAVAFVDMRMPPGWDGVETIEHLWQADLNLQVVICTAFSDHPWEVILRRLGLTDKLLILRKPFDGIEAWQLANALTSKWGAQRQDRERRDDLEAEVRRRTAELQQAQELAAAQQEEIRALNAELEAARTRGQPLEIQARSPASPTANFSPP